MAAEELYRRIEDRSLRVGVMGLGYVGLPLAVAFAEEGFPVLGVEVDPARREAARSARSYVPDVADEQLAAAVKSGRLEITGDSAALSGADTVHICVPTPLSKTKDPDVSYILAAADQVAQIFHRGMLVVMESTTYPGTTEELLLPRLSADGAEPGQDFYLAYSPERLDPGNRRHTLRSTPRVVGGFTPACGRLAAAVYRTIVGEVHLVSSCRAAEMVKLLENTFRAVNIALANEVAMMCDGLGIDTWEVIEAAATKPFGFMPFYPGPGLGGHCVPVDPHYLTWKVRSVNLRARLIELATEINAAMPHYVVQKVVDALNERRKTVNGSRILMLGVAYKRDVSDIRESPAIDMMRLLAAKGAEVHFSDPHVPRLEEGFNPPLTSVGGLPEACRDYDCVVVGTDHSAFDWPRLIEAAPLLIDTRNVSRGAGGSHVVRI